MNQKLTVKDVMSKPVSIAKSALIPEALDKMLAEGIDPIVVTNDRVVVGTASRRTIAEKMGSKKTGNIPASQIRVASVTREDFTSVYQDQDVDLLIPLLQRYKIVVVWDEEHRLIGQVTTGDLLKIAKPERAVDTMMELAPRISPDDRVVQLPSFFILSLTTSNTAVYTSPGFEAFAKFTFLAPTLSLPMAE